MFFRASIPVLLIALGEIVASAAPVTPGIPQLQVKLYELAETLRRRGITKSTYTLVEPAAVAAHSTPFRWPRRTRELYRAPTSSSTHWGDDPHAQLAGLYANTYDQTAAKVNGFQWPPTKITDGFAYTAPAASFRPNNFDLYDMLSNAREFMADTWIGFLGASANDESVPKGPAPFPVVRGGAWNYSCRHLRINYRDPYYSSEVASNMFGIRLVRELWWEA
ncbi:hypothetical protein HIM_03953 [Hirsutella minnesotensis 3608]|uniref:Sulfatase-modifying factor enzyme-like domain-containing protein n=1 Tax=Hirsutella minnesotensis 3608 TaxID=1043627 RepID=A0A0F8A205_9HYPO|nr:hypothetical protein HIM_03953 [Hirsutella minnesotensis 3608]